jgi:hypothetical protein
MAIPSAILDFKNHVELSEGCCCRFSCGGGKTSALFSSIFTLRFLSSKEIDRIDCHLADWSRLPYFLIIYKVILRQNLNHNHTCDYQHDHNYQPAAGIASIDTCTLSPAAHVT